MSVAPNNAMATKGLGDQAKKGQIGQLYADMITKVEGFFSECRENALTQQKTQERQAQQPVVPVRMIYTESNPYTSFASSPTKKSQSPVDNTPSEPQQRLAGAGLR